MLIRLLAIEGFRGIRWLSWELPAGVCCLIGAGDAGKTTVLDALELVLSPRWAVAIHDRDFTDREVSRNILIEATVTDVPRDLLREDRFGLQVRGWSSDSALRDEPADGDEAALTLRFRVGDDLEPTWAVVNDRVGEGVPISARQRERLGIGRVGATVDADFRWTRGTALARLTGDRERVSGVLTEANREARRAVAEADLSGLDNALAQAREGAIALAAGDVADRFAAALEDTSAWGGPRLALHSRDLPLSTYGLGTRRVVAIGLQLAACQGASVLLLDELEHGLEPYRVRRLVRSLRSRVTDPDLPTRQVVTTTHSSVAVEQFKATEGELHVVHAYSDETVRVQPVPGELQKSVRTAPESYLAKQVLVCEGKTEVGLCHGLDDPAVAHFTQPWSHRGVVPTYGGGHEAGKVAREFARLGYRTALFADSDQPLDPSVEELASAGVEVVSWADGVATEARVASDLPVEALDELVALADEVSHGGGIAAEIRARCNMSSAQTEPSAWLAAGGDEQGIRQAIAAELAERKVFKDFDRAEKLAHLLAAHWDALADRDVRRKFEQLDRWVAGE